jgi:drug/metabolite transporter (DMT)-like permease
MAVVLGLLVAASFGSGDFLGGLASRQARTLAVLAISQVAALVGALVVSFAVGGHLYGGDLAFGAVAGALNVAAIGCLYRGLAIGQMGQVAPIAAVIGAVLPVLWGLVRGERPGVPALVGIVLAVVAAALLSSEREERQGPLFGRALALAAAAGVGFGISLILFAAASHHGGVWPVLSARVTALVVVWASLAVVGGIGGVREVPKVRASSAGLLDVGASTLLLIALRGNLTAVVAPVASLAPGFTSLHAWWYLHERVSRVQLAGLAVALIGLGLIATA